MLGNCLLKQRRLGKKKFNICQSSGPLTFTRERNTLTNFGPSERLVVKSPNRLTVCIPPPTARLRLLSHVRGEHQTLASRSRGRIVSAILAIKFLCVSRHGVEQETIVGRQLLKGGEKVPQQPRVSPSRSVSEAREQGCGVVGRVVNSSAESFARGVALGCLGGGASPQISLSLSIQRKHWHSNSSTSPQPHCPQRLISLGCHLVDAFQKTWEGR